jgi:hypothetical protein
MPISKPTTTKLNSSYGPRKGSASGLSKADVSLGYDFGY